MTDSPSQRAATFRIDAFDVGLEGHEPLLPATGTMLRWIAGPDRPDYVLFRFDRPFQWVPGPGVDRTRLSGLSSGPTPGSVLVPLGLFAARMAGERPHPGMRDFPVGLAFVLDESVLHAATLDFSQAEYVAVALISDTSGQ